METSESIQSEQLSVSGTHLRASAHVIGRYAGGSCHLAGLPTLLFLLQTIVNIKVASQHVYMSGLELINLAMLRWSRCTPSLRTGVTIFH
jgi:hypothetical protein